MLRTALAVEVMFAVLVVATEGHAMTDSEYNYCHGFAELHAEMARQADASDPDGDAAYNYAFDLCEGATFSRVSGYPENRGACYLGQIAGGWSAVDGCDAGEPNAALDDSPLVLVPVGGAFAPDSDGSLVEVGGE